MASPHNRSFLNMQQQFLNKDACFCKICFVIP